jgi:hypothetical protein
VLSESELDALGTLAGCMTIATRQLLSRELPGDDREAVAEVLAFWETTGAAVREFLALFPAGVTVH